jgi:TonB family protein
VHETTPAVARRHLRTRALVICLHRVATASVLSMTPFVASAQATGTLSGTVRDSLGAPVPMAEVTILSSSMRAVTNDSGIFRFDQAPLGARIVRARRIGFRQRESAVTIEAVAPATLAIVLSRLAQELDAVVVQAQLDRRARQLSGFYERKRLGAGRFITQDRIDRRNAVSLPELLASELPGIRVVSTRYVNQGIRLRGQSCAPLVWIDGAPAPAAEFDLSAIAPISVGAIEVYYGPASVPGEFQLPRGLHACGAVVIWSRMWEPREPRRKKPAPSLDSALAELKVYVSDEVEHPARVDSARLVTPAYPDSLYAYRVAGQVVAEFVVDTTGEIRPPSIGVVSSTHPLFSEAVRRALLESRFVPARLNGRKVAQVMLLPFRFELSRGR